MTFEQFQLTRRHVADIGSIISADMGTDKPVPGLLYCGTLYIADVTKELEEFCNREVAI